MESNDETYEILPEHMRDAARTYIELGLPPGGFLYAVLSNNLKEALGRADRINLDCISDWVQWLVWNCPTVAQGNEDRVKEWIKIGGMQGLKKTDIHEGD